MRAHISKSRHHFVFKWFDLRVIETAQYELIEALLGEVIAGELVKELIYYLWSAVQVLDVKTSELADAQGGLDLFIEVFNYPGHRPWDGLFVVYFEVDS